MRSFPINLPYGLFLDSSRNFGVGTSTPFAFMEARKDQNAQTTLQVSNFTTNASSSAMLAAITGTTNSFITLAAYDNSGVPYTVLQAGSAVTAIYYQGPTHAFRSQAGTEIARFEASTASLKFAVDGLALTGTATAANFMANTASKILSTDKVWSAAAPVSLATVTGSITLDFNTFINCYMTLTGNLTISTTNTKPGQSGTIDFIQDGTGSRTLSYTAGKFSSTGTLPTIASAASARTRLFYYVDETGRVFMSGSSSAIVNN